MPSRSLTSLIMMLYRYICFFRFLSFFLAAVLRMRSCRYLMLQTCSLLLFDLLAPTICGTDLIVFSSLGQFNVIQAHLPSVSFLVSFRSLVCSAFCYRSLQFSIWICIELPIGVYNACYESGSLYRPLEYYLIDGVFALVALIWSTVKHCCPCTCCCGSRRNSNQSVSPVAPVPLPPKPAPVAAAPASSSPSPQNDRFQEKDRCEQCHDMVLHCCVENGNHGCYPVEFCLVLGSILYSLHWISVSLSPPYSSSCTDALFHFSFYLSFLIFRFKLPFWSFPTEPLLDSLNLVSVLLFLVWLHACFSVCSSLVLPFVLVMQATSLLSVDSRFLVSSYHGKEKSIQDFQDDWLSSNSRPLLLFFHLSCALCCIPYSYPPLFLCSLSLLLSCFWSLLFFLCRFYFGWVLLCWLLESASIFQDTICTKLVQNPFVFVLDSLARTVAPSSLWLGPRLWHDGCGNFIIYFHRNTLAWCCDMVHYSQVLSLLLLLSFSRWAVSLAAPPPLRRLSFVFGSVVWRRLPFALGSESIRVHYLRHCKTDRSLIDTCFDRNQTDRQIWCNKCEYSVLSLSLSRSVTSSMSVT